MQKLKGLKAFMGNYKGDVKTNSVRATCVLNVDNLKSILDMGDRLSNVCLKR